MQAAQDAAEDTGDEWVEDCSDDDRDEVVRATTQGRRGGRLIDGEKRPSSRARNIRKRDVDIGEHQLPPFPPTYAASPYGPRPPLMPRPPPRYPLGPVSESASMTTQTVAYREVLESPAPSVTVSLRSRHSSLSSASRVRRRADSRISRVVSSSVPIKDIQATQDAVEDACDDEFEEYSDDEGQGDIAVTAGATVTQPQRGERGINGERSGWDRSGDGGGERAPPPLPPRPLHAPPQLLLPPPLMPPPLMPRPSSRLEFMRVPAASVAIYREVLESPAPSEPGSLRSRHGSLGRSGRIRRRSNASVNSVGSSTPAGEAHEQARVAWTKGKA
ncbi:hypothetical protein HK405_000922 [Cladochytrium tenue]|nr:hypothetical protein HK405_000922 [Cladochytrium tenue]